MEEKTSDLDLVSVLRILRRRAGWIVVCLVLTAGGAYGFSKHQRKLYTATASILFQDQQLQQQAAGLPGVVVSNPQSQTDTNLKLATLPRIAAATAAVVGHGATTTSIESDVSVSQESDTDLATVSATSPSPHLSAQIANDYARQAIAYRQLSDGTFYTNALRAVTRQLNDLTPAQQSTVQGVDLRDRAAALQILAQLQGNEIQLAQPASVPNSPSSPKTLRNVALGALVGLLLGLGIAFGLERFDRRLREPSDLEAAYGLPLLGVVPTSTALKAQTSGSKLGELLPEREAEIFGLLRAHVRYFNVDRGLKLVAIASAAPGDGKSTIARNLAAAGARVGERVLFVEADFRRPVAAKTFGVSHTPGIAELLMNGLKLEEAAQQSVVAEQSGRQISVDVLVAGGVLPSNPGQVTESQAMRGLIREARERYDLVVVDTPPLSILSDAFPLLREADGVIIVGRVGQNRRDVAERLRTTLETANIPLVGVVANGYRQRGSSPYGYGYGYGYGYAYDYRNGKAESRPVVPSNGAIRTANGAGQTGPAALQASEASHGVAVGVAAPTVEPEQAADPADTPGGTGTVQPESTRRERRRWSRSRGVFRS